MISRLDAALTAYDFGTTPPGNPGGARTQGYYSVTRYSYTLSAVVYTDAHHGLFFAPQRFGETWKIDRITINNTSTSQVPAVYVMRGRVSEVTAFAPTSSLTYPHEIPKLQPTSALVEYTPSGTNDVADLSSPIWLTAGEYVSVLFAGAQIPTASQVMQSTVYLTGEVHFR